MGSTVVTSIARDAGLSQLIDGALEAIASGFVFTEGPLWLPDASLLFQDLRASKTYRWTEAAETTLVREATRGANGQALGRSGRIVFCEQDGRRVSAMNCDGSGVEVLVETFEGKRLNSPNDCISGPDGRLFFTDPAYGVPRPEEKELPFQGVFQFDLERTELRLLAHADFEKPNGLAFAPDGRTLFVNDTGKYHVRRLSLEAPSSARPYWDVIDDRIFATFDPSEPGGPDGIKVDVHGRLYVAVAEGVWVLGNSGELLGILKTPKRPSNLAWGGTDRRTLFITAVDQVHRISFRDPGI